MIERFLGQVRTPTAGLAGVVIDRSKPVVRDADGALLIATLTGPDGADPSEIDHGIWGALGGVAPPRTLAQLSNVVPPVPQLYERVWRRRSLGLLSRRPFPVTEELAELDAALPDVAGARCVDVGCSEGLYARHLARRGAIVAAIDHSRPFLRRARLRAARESVEIAAIRATAQRLPFLDATLDAAAIGGSLNEIGDRAGAIAEAARVLRPGGRMFVMSLVAAPTRPGRILQAAVRPSGIEFPAASAATVEFEAAGFTVVDERLDGVVARTTLVRRG
jgi:SAM-dependent methyltransferase